MASQGDVLAAAALLLTLLGVLYALWYGEIQAALQMKAQPVRTKADFEAGVSVLWTRAIPLVVATGLDFVVFAPAALTPAHQWAVATVQRPAQIFASYDPVPVAIGLASLFTLALGIETLTAGWRLWRHCYRDLRPQPK